jgi:hypothetical protein
MFTLSHPTAADKYEEGFPAADCFELALNHPKQLAAIDPTELFLAAPPVTFFLTAQSFNCYTL